MIKKAQLFKQKGGWVVTGDTSACLVCRNQNICTETDLRHAGGGGGGGGGGWNQLSETERFTTVRPWMESVETLKAAVMASICVQHDRLVLINTFKEGTVPRQRKSTFAVQDAESLFS